MQAFVFYEKPERKQLPLRLSWIKNVGASIFMSAPLVYRKRLFTASVDDNESGKAAVVCMDAQNGTVCWRYSLRGSVRSSIAIADGLVFAQDGTWLPICDSSRNWDIGLGKRFKYRCTSSFE